VVSQDEDVCVIRGIVPPPASPSVIRPIAPDGCEHVAAEDPGSDVLETAGLKVIVHAGLPSARAEKLLERTGSRSPLVEHQSAPSKRIVQILIRARAITVQRDRETVDTKPRHLLAPPYRAEHYPRRRFSP